jgi:hypothetical protein
MNDPIYRSDLINADPIWKLAFELSEVDNDDAPLGWSAYVPMARHLLSRYRLIEKLGQRSGFDRRRKVDA